MDYTDWRLGTPQLDPRVAEIRKWTPPAPPKQDGYWQKSWEGVEQAPRIHVIDKSPWGNEVKGWTVCDKQRRLCDIFITKGANRECVEEHENQHAAGYDHPNHPRAFICPN